MAGAAAAGAPAASPRSWSLRLDGARCDGHGICAVCCPEHISLDDWGYAVTSSSPLREGERSLARARRAVTACPAHALALVPAPQRGGTRTNPEPAARAPAWTGYGPASPTADPASPTAGPASPTADPASVPSSLAPEVSGSPSAPTAQTSPARRDPALPEGMA
jgi:ferredoxin